MPSDDSTQATTKATKNQLVSDQSQPAQMDSPMIEETIDENIAPIKESIKSKGIKAFLTDLPK